jgi:predicted DNA-binding transcriptional regulator AlpA
MPVDIKGITYYSSPEVLEACSISRQTLWRWRKEGKIPDGRRFRDGSLLYTESDYEVIQDYANSVEPIAPGSENQMQFFK